MNKEVAYSYLEKTKELKGNLEEGFIMLGERLSKIRSEELWKAGHESFLDFLEEMRMSEATASKLISIYDKLVVGLGLSKDTLSQAKDWSNVYLISSISKTKDEAEGWLEKATELRNIDFRREVQESKTGIAMADCKHKETYSITICRKCGMKTKDHDND